MHGGEPPPIHAAENIGNCRAGEDRIGVGLMSAPLRRTLLCLLVAALAFLAHAPLLGSGFVGGDLDLLAAAAGRSEPGPEPSAWLARGEVRPIPAAILRVHAELYEGLSPLEPAVAAPYFAFALVVLLLAAAGAGVTLRRVLVPWLGESAARAAGWACAGLVVAHPASVAAVARPIALGDLLALAAGTWCTAFFLRGRQQRRDRFLVIAALLAITAGFASSAAWLLPFACAGLEFTSAHRPRAFPRRLLSAATVALVAAVAVAIEAAFAWPHNFGVREGTPLWAFSILGVPGAQAHRLDPIAVLNTLGVIFVPAPSPGSGGYYFACGAILLLAAEPLLHAVRSAPRLWGWLVLSWIVAVATVLCFTRDLDVPPGRIELGTWLLPASICVCAALATAATALGGSRRTVIPLAIAAMLCILSDRTARLWPERSRELLALRADLERGLKAAGSAGVVQVVGAPSDYGHHEPPVHVQRGGFGTPSELELLAGIWPPMPRLEPGRLRRAQPEALPYLVRSRESEALRRKGLAVLLLDREDHPAFVVPPPTESAKTFSWRDEERTGKSPWVELDPTVYTMVRVTPLAGISTAEPPRMRWRATNTTFENGAIEGVWVATADGPQAIFDLGRSIEWLLGGVIRRVTFEGELRRIATGEILPRIDVPGVTTPMAAPPLETIEAALPRPWTGNFEWVLVGVIREWNLVNFQTAASSTEEERRAFWSSLQRDGALTGILEVRSNGVTVARTPAFGPEGR